MQAASFLPRGIRPTPLRDGHGIVPPKNSYPFLKSQIVTLQTAQSWANAGVCGDMCACAVSGT